MDLENCDSFLNLALQGFLMLKHVDKLRVVDLKKHASDLAGQIRIHVLDEREDAFTQHLLLFLRWGRSQHGSS